MFRFAIKEYRQSYEHCRGRLECVTEGPETFDCCMACGRWDDWIALALLLFNGASSPNPTNVSRISTIFVNALFPASCGEDGPPPTH